MKKIQRQEMTIRALSSASSMAEAAEMAGITRRTLYTYLQDPLFVQELEKAHNSLMIEQGYSLEGVKKQAEGVLAELMNDSDPKIRLRAAKITLDNAYKRELFVTKLIAKQVEAADDPMKIFSSLAKWR